MTEKRKSHIGYCRRLAFFTAVWNGQLQFSNRQLPVRYLSDKLINYFLSIHRTVNELHQRLHDAKCF